MPPKTTSSTLVVGEYTYIFINRPDTQHIDYIRFKKAADAQTGKIGVGSNPIIAAEGPIDSLTFPNNSIRVYYIEMIKENQHLVREIKLDNANDRKTDPQTQFTWRTDKTKDLIFEEKVSLNIRLVDATSFLAVTMRNGQPAVTYKVNNQDLLQYNYYDGKMYQTTTLDIPNL